MGVSREFSPDALCGASQFGDGLIFLTCSQQRHRSYSLQKKFLPVLDKIFDIEKNS